MSAYALADMSVPDGVEAICLAQNEHAYPPAPSVLQAIAKASENAHLYPDSDWNELRQAIALVHRLNPDNILCGSGSMELMLALTLAYLDTDDRVLLTEHGYLFMRTLIQLNEAKLDIAPETDLHIDIDAVLEMVKHDTRLVFIVNPGNPTGTIIHNDEIRRLRESLPADCLLVVDEAYAEYCRLGFHAPLFDLIERGDTIIFRTFSKIYGLAGMRVGWGYFPQDILVQVRKTLNPSNVTVTSQAAARAAMLDQETMSAARQAIALQRNRLSQSISELSFDVVPGETNFVLVQFDSEDKANRVDKFLRSKGIIVRPMGGYGLKHCLRITIGTEPQVTILIDALRSRLR
jgi:histidinol-phosphate aminotransferase